MPTRCGTIDMLAFPTTGTTFRVAELQAAPIALNSNLGATPIS
jgi:allophanate hydrolase